MKRQLSRSALVLALAFLAGPLHARTDGEQAVAGVGERLRANDCEGAVRQLNAQLVAGYPEVALLAGTMFEAGFCVGKDWDKAVRFYSRASEGGVREGALRLAAGFAADAHGPDIAAAMWWASRARLEAERCTAHLPKTEDPDRFVEELRKQDPHELAVCNYVVGTLSFLQAEARYPMTGVSREIAGRADVDYWPASSRFKMDADSNATNPARHGMLEVMGRAMHFGGARYARPAGINPDWTVPFVIVFDTDKSRWW